MNTSVKLLRQLPVERSATQKQTRHDSKCSKKRSKFSIGLILTTKSVQIQTFLSQLWNQWHLSTSSHLMITQVKQPWLRLVHRWVTIRWKVVAHGKASVPKSMDSDLVAQWYPIRDLTIGKASVPKFKNWSISGSRFGCVLIPDKALWQMRNMQWTIQNKEMSYHM